MGFPGEVYRDESLSAFQWIILLIERRAVALFETRLKRWGGRGGERLKWLATGKTAFNCFCWAAIVIVSLHRG